MILTKILFLLTTALALTLGATTFAASWLRQLELPQPIERFVALLSGDKIVRRAAFVCSLGLLATAWIFFRPSAHSHDTSAREIADSEEEADLPQKNRPGSVAGA